MNSDFSINMNSYEVAEFYRTSAILPVKFLDMAKFVLKNATEIIFPLSPICNKRVGKVNWDSLRPVSY